MKRNAPHKYPWEHPEDPDFERQPVEDLDNLDEEQLDPGEHAEDPDYDNPQCRRLRL
jgi:hypothetical protein